MTSFRDAAQIDVGHNYFDQAASLELIAAMKGKNMVSIGMASCSLGVEGAKIVAEMASVMGSLTAADLRFNYMGSEAEHMLRDCVKGRAGFDLKL